MSNMVGKKWNMGGSAKRNSAVCCLKILQLSNPWHWDDYLARQNLQFCSFCKALLASEDSTPVITETANSVRTDDIHVLKSIQVKSCFWTCYHLLYHILLTSSYIIYHISSIISINTYQIMSYRYSTVHSVFQVLFAWPIPGVPSHQQLQQEDGRLRQPPGLKTHRLRCHVGACPLAVARMFMELRDFHE